MTDLSRQTVRHRRVSAELKRMREASGKNAYEVADAMRWNRTKVHRLERGEWKRLKEADVRRLADFYGVADRRRVDALVAMARQASTRGWWARYSDVLGPGSYTSLEAGASELRFYSGMLVPGLLQTSSYAEAIFRGADITDDAEITRRLEARRARQEILGRSDSPSIHAIIDQAALNKVIGRPSAMAEQLLHLVEVGKRGKAKVQVLPDTAGSHPALTGQFAILSFPSEDEEPVVFIDSAHNGLFLEEPDEIASYTLIFDRLRELVLSAEDSYELIASLVNRLVE
ncbi:XRE family transcriptional regulator [Nocardiopsis gilva YIM 90087]|uniref:XRE family transcriptional regulator n=1 Tax=Nocardiopsis gilva YIM 90087 TaxID=1235441 RepID=A0A223S3G0_9ACTN|nr:helix-turn-helix transcriptional regulator [Nocardiopsis gilva]ASU82549.1 XRE family transcriptional regulator [Nocardiopsis gilva YIM 90087]